MRAVTNDPAAPSRVGDVVTIIAVMTALATLAVVVRLFIKLRMTGSRLLWDDHLILLSLGLSFVHGSICLAQIRYGSGHHLSDLTDEVRSDMWKSVKLFYFNQLAYFAMIGTIKMSILVFYLRLSRTLLPAVNTTMAFVIGSSVACFLAAVFQCTPIPFDWDESLNGHCIDRTVFYFTNAGLNIFSDIVIYVLPMPTLWRVQISLNHRIGLIFVFALGGFVVITGILRLQSLRTASVTKDPTWDNVPSIIWSEAEFNVGIVCACLPYMKPLFMRILGVKSVSGSNPPQRGTSMVITAPRANTTMRNNGHVTDAMAPDDGTALYEVKVLSTSVRQVDEDGLMVGSRDQLVDVESGGIMKTTKVVVSSS